MTKFYANVNPFLGLVRVYTLREDPYDMEEELGFEGVDEWNWFSFKGVGYNIHYFYDEDFSLSIYEDVKVFLSDTIYDVDYSKQCEVEVTICLTDDEFYRDYEPR